MYFSLIKLGVPAGVVSLQQKNKKEINKRVVGDTTLLFRVLTYIDIEITCKISKTEWDFEIWNFFEIEILPDLTHKNQGNSLNL